MTDPQEIAKWRRAHQGISVPDEGLQTVAPFPSLYAKDFAVYLEASGQPREFVRFVEDLNRETIWVYDNWQKAQHDGNPKLLLVDMLNNTTPVGGAQGGGPPPDYSMVRKFLRDYAKAHGIALGSEEPERPSWMSAFGPAGAVREGTGTSSTGGGDALPQAPPAPALGGLVAAPGPMPAAGDA